MQSFFGDVLGSISDVFWSMFDHGDVFGSLSDGNQPTVWLLIEYGDVFKSVFYVSDMFGNSLYFGAVLRD